MIVKKENGGGYASLIRRWGTRNGRRDLGSGSLQK